jgi:hypothetical protein
MIFTYFFFTFHVLKAKNISGILEFYKLLDFYLILTLFARQRLVGQYAACLVSVVLCKTALPFLLIFQSRFFIL